jgi:hypothetical protein
MQKMHIVSPQVCAENAHTKVILGTVAKNATVPSCCN